MELTWEQILQEVLMKLICNMCLEITLDISQVPMSESFIIKPKSTMGTVTTHSL